MKVVFPYFVGAASVLVQVAGRVDPGLEPGAARRVPEVSATPRAPVDRSTKMETRRPGFFQSLRGRLSLLMLVVSIVPLLVVGGLVYNGMNSSQESAGRSVDDSKTALEIDVVQRNLSEEAHRLAMELDKDMADRVVLGLFCANGVAATGAVTSLLPQDISKADLLLMEQLKDTQYLSMFQYFGPEIPDPVHPGETIIPLLGGAYSWYGSPVPGAFPFYLMPAEVGGLGGNLKRYGWYSFYPSHQGETFVTQPYWVPAEASGWNNLLLTLARARL